LNIANFLVYCINKLWIGKHSYILPPTVPGFEDDTSFDTEIHTNNWPTYEPFGVLGKKKDYGID